MEDSAFSNDFCSFLQTAVPSVATAELLLHLFHHSGRSWDVRELPRALSAGVSITEAEARNCAEALRGRGLVALDAEGHVQYEPQSETLDALVRTLAQAYNERPVTLIRMIYALRDSKIKSFADAFKFRKT